MSHVNRIELWGSAVALMLLPALAAPADSHLWRFNEIFSNGDGSVVFIEMKECCGAGNEVFLINKWIQSQATSEMFTFPSNLPCTDCTALKTLLLATQSFANLPNAPQPDFIIQPQFFETAGPELLRYWFYGAADWSFNGVPTDGIESLNRDGTTGPNSPMNFAGATASVIAPCVGADVFIDGAVDVNDLLAVISAWGPCPNPANCPPDFVPIGGDGAVNINELLGVINAWGACK